MIVAGSIPKHEPMPDRTDIVRCHMIKQHTREQCSAEALSDAEGDPRICERHAAEVMQFIAAAKRAARRSA